MKYRQTLNKTLAWSVPTGIAGAIALLVVDQASLLASIGWVAAIAGFTAAFVAMQLLAALDADELLAAADQVEQEYEWVYDLEYSNRDMRAGGAA